MAYSSTLTNHIIFRSAHYLGHRLWLCAKAFIFYLTSDGGITPASADVQSTIINNAHSNCVRVQLQTAKMPEQKGEETFDVMELAEYAKKQKWWNRVFGKETDSGPPADKYSVMTQLVIGGVTGWCAGYLFQKVGKLAASAVGGGFLLLQIANHTGYVTVDWKRVERDMNKAKKQLKLNTDRPPKGVQKEVRTKVQEVQSFAKKNLVLTGGFAGGFLIGLAS